MKKIGLIGGLSPESTISYYDGIIRLFTDTYDKRGYPEIIIESLDLKYYTQLAQSNEWDKIASGISERFNVLKNAGAKFGAIVANTPHKVFNEIQNKTQLPLISIVDATMTYALKHQFTKLLLLGTGFTMSSDFYPAPFKNAGIDLITPNKKEKEYIHNSIFTEMVLGIFKQKTKIAIEGIVDRICTENKADGVILACTELPILLEQKDLQVKLIDPSTIHINAIAEFCREG
jgi:aspartate racemase